MFGNKLQNSAGSVPQANPIQTAATNQPAQTDTTMALLQSMSQKIDAIYQMVTKDQTADTQEVQPAM